VVQAGAVCNPVLAGDRQPVHVAGGELVAHAGTYDCPPPPQVVAAVPQVEPAAPPPEPLPWGGIVYFDLDSAEIREDAETTLAAMVADIRGRELTGITVAGYTDTSGSANYNEALSERRAEAVASWLAAEGVSARVIAMEAFGETRPAVPTDDGVALEANRRVVVDFAR
jgi:OOP family OmpA-OmpF porin